MSGRVPGRVVDLADLRDRLLRLTAEQRKTLLKRLTPVQQRGVNEHWPLWAHEGQIEPADGWRVWMMQAGRGFGKTRAGAEAVSEVARNHPGARIALVAATVQEGVRVMVEGESGLLAVARGHEPLDWCRDRGELIFASGAVAFLYSAATPEALRGPQHHFAWCDELAKWRHGEAAWDNLLMGLRLGDRPRAVVTTTPLPVPLVRKVIATAGTIRSRGRTRDNPHLPPVVVDELEAQYGGTRLGRQELDGELLEDHEGALWTRGLIERCRAAAAPELVRVVVGVDPPASANGDACGIVAVGLDAQGNAHVLADASVAGQSPAGWAAAVADCALAVGADRVVAEANQGGEMVREVLAHADRAMPVRLVHATRGKVARAEPVAHLYEAGRVRHAGAFPALEDELCGMVVGGVYAGPGRSPDRADALVWAVTELCLRGRGGAARVRGL